MSREGPLSRNILAIFLTIAVIWIVGVLIQGFASANGWTLANADFSLAGSFGDSFGGLSAFMATAAAIGAWEAVRYQRKEIESSSSRERELDRISAKRDFETTFFNMLELLRSTVNEINYQNFRKTEIYNGREALAAILQTIRSHVANTSQDWKSSYARVYHNYRDDLAHYFRLVYHLVKYIDQSDIQDKMIYVRLLRATLSNTEIVLIGINCIYGGGISKFKPLVEKYALLHNISSTDAHETTILSNFDPSAFGDRTVIAGNMLSE